MSSPYFEQIFQLKFTTKQLERASKKAEKESKLKKKKVAEYLKKGNGEIARVYANDAIRKHNESLNFLRLSSRIDGVRSRLESMQANKQLTMMMDRVTKEMEKSMQSMNIEQISHVMNQFEEKFDDLDVATSTVEASIDKTTATMIPIDQVDDLIRAVADENNLELASLLPEIAQGQGQGVAQPQGKDQVKVKGVLAD